MKEANKLKIGDSVKVKSNVKDPDFNILIEDWQGRISEINEKENIIDIKWYSITLENMSNSIIDECEEEGLSWSEMSLSISELELVESRDREKDVQQKIKELERKHVYSYLGEQGRRIQNVLKHISPDDEWKNMETWENHFKKILQFPFEAIVSEVQEYGLDVNDKVKAEEISLIDESYGVIVKIRKGRKIYHTPLCDLEVRDRNSSNYQPVYDYAVWFANR